MALTHPALSPEAPGLIDRLGALCRTAGLDGLATRIHHLGELSGDDLHAVEAALATLLEHRGRVGADRAVYLRVVEGKTAALFCWAMFAGARAGGLGEAACRALERYGRELGIAFQAIDDLLDFTGSSAATGKALFA